MSETKEHITHGSIIKSDNFILLLFAFLREHSHDRLKHIDTKIIEQID